MATSHKVVKYAGLSSQCEFVPIAMVNTGRSVLSEAAKQNAIVKRMRNSEYAEWSFLRCKELCHNRLVSIVTKFCV